MAGRTLLLFSAMCLLAAGLNGAAAQGLLGAPPAKAPAGTAPDSVTPQATTPGGAAGPPTPPVAWPPSEPAAPIQPGSPTGVVRPFYDQVGLEVDPAQRGHFIDPA